MEKKMYRLEISEDFEHVMPPLTKQETETLTESLLSNGCLEPLIVWNGMIVDGHARYRICWKHGIPFSFVTVNFANKEEAILWSVRNQIGRRNLVPFQRCELVLPLEEALKAEAKKRQGWKGNDGDSCGEHKGDTRDKLARMAGVSHSTISYVKQILKEADTETLTRLRKGEISINHAYKEISNKYSLSKKGVKQSDSFKNGGYPKTENIRETFDIQSLDFIGDTVKELLTLVSEGEATTKVIIEELQKVAGMIDEMASINR